ncbi:hypothetical protein VTI74DRAFT_6110 [Chaetomium olivicolor]
MVRFGLRCASGEMESTGVARRGALAPCCKLNTLPKAPLKDPCRPQLPRPMALAPPCQGRSHLPNHWVVSHRWYLAIGGCCSAAATSPRRATIRSCKFFGGGYVMSRKQSFIASCSPSGPILKSRWNWAGARRRPVAGRPSGQVPQRGYDTGQSAQPRPRTG